MLITLVVILAVETAGLVALAACAASLKMKENNAAALRETERQAAAAALDRQKESFSEAQRLLTEQYEKRLVQQQQEFDRSRGELDKRWKLELNNLHEEFQNSAGKMLDERTQKLDDGNHKRMNELFDPFKEKLKELQESLTVSHKERASLKTEVQLQLQAVQKNADRMSSEADKLTNALKGTNKLQGNWGELQLEQALVDCGLVKDVNFFTQCEITNEKGQRYVSPQGECFTPDATVRFPDGRRLFIDSKMSMTAYMRYIEADDDETRADALKKHLESVRTHVKSLSDKGYHNAGNKAIPGSSFEYTILFMGNEGALTLALSSDADLWESAFRHHHVILVSRMSLYPLLWLIRMSWNFEQQSRNQQNILTSTALLIERLEKFAEAFSDVGSRLDAARKSYDGACNTLCQSSQSVIKTGRRVAELMGKEAKKMKALDEKHAARMLEDEGGDGIENNFLSENACTADAAAAES